MRPTSIENFHGLILTLIINYVTLDILHNTVPLLVPLLPPRAPECLNVVIAVPLIFYFIFSIIVYVPLFVSVPLLPIVVTVPFIFGGPVLYLCIVLYYCICLGLFLSVASVGFLLQ